MTSLTLILTGLAWAATPVWSTDLQADPGGLTSSGDPAQWEWGVVASGPGEGLNGSHAWATRLQNVHMNDADDRLTLPDVDLRGTTRPVLVLHHWFDLEPDGHDLGYLQYFDGLGWVGLSSLQGTDSFTGTSPGWQSDYFDLTGVDSLSQVRLRFEADATVARDGWYIGGIEVLDGDPMPPTIAVVDSPTDTQDLSGPYPIAVSASDDLGIERVYIEWYTGVSTGTTPDLTLGEDGYWTGSLPGAAPGTTYVWWAMATDAAGNEAYARGPSFRVYLPAPTELTAPEGRVVSPTVELSWTAPESLWPILSHQVRRNGLIVAVTNTTSVAAPVEGPDDRFTVAATFQTSLGAVEGDESEAVRVDAHPPTITRLSPAGGWPGDQLRVELEGRYLLLTSDEVSLELGPGVEVLDLEVIDVDRLRAFVEILPSATPGVHDVIVRTMDQDIVASGAFEVRSGDSRPRVVDITPARLVQGSHSTLSLRANVALDPSAPVDLGAGVVVQSVVSEGERGLRLQVAVANDAPTGARPVEADIGTRILTSRDDLLRVVPPQPSPQTLCGVASASPGLLWMGLLLFGLARRQDRADTPN